MPRTAPGSNDPGPQQRAPGAPVAAPTGSAAPSGGPGWSAQRDGDGRRGGVGRDPGARVAAAAWRQERPGLPGTSATVLAPGCAVGAMVAAIVMAGATLGVRRAELPGALRTNFGPNPPPHHGGSLSTSRSCPGGYRLRAEGEAIATLVANKLRGGMRVAAVKAPGRAWPAA
jgi:hypothetical protein